MKMNKKIASLAVAGALILSGLGAVQSAQAEEIPGIITITPTSGSANGVFLQSIAASVGAPVGFRGGGTTAAFQNGVLMGQVSLTRTPAMPATAGTSGLDGNPALLTRVPTVTNGNVSNRALSAIANPLATGPFELRFYYHAVSFDFDYAVDKWISLPMTFNAVTQTWAVATPAVPATGTTTSLTASATGSDVTVTATVTPTAAAGTVTFLEGVTPVATGIAVVAGVASTVLAGVLDGTRTYTAQFVPTDPALFTGSTSLTATVQVGSITAPGSSPSNITVIVPTGAGNLFLTSSSASVALGTATLGGGTLNASGTLSAVVTDQRQIGAGTWNLTGLVSNFTRTVPASPAATIAGTYLGWTPSVATNTIGSTAGGAVAPSAATGGGLASSRNLASGSPDLGGGVTNASALLALAAPGNTAAGTYSATLTLTLI